MHKFVLYTILCTIYRNIIYLNVLYLRNYMFIPTKCINMQILFKKHLKYTSSSDTILTLILTK